MSEDLEVPKNWVSPDWKDIPCPAVNCVFNFNGQCMTASRSHFMPDGSCAGFIECPVPSVWREEMELYKPYDVSFW